MAAKTQAMPGRNNSMTELGQSVLRRRLDRLYLASGILAGFFLAMIAVTIIAQVVGRFAGLAIDSTELAGFCMAASTFLGLAYTLKNGTHVRVNLLIRAFPPPLKRAVEAVCSMVGILAATYFTCFSVLLTLQSWQFGDTSPGLIAAPFWIPQTGMAIGGALLTIAFVDELVIILRGGTAGYEIEDSVLGSEPVEPSLAGKTRATETDRIIAAEPLRTTSS